MKPYVTWALALLCLPSLAAQSNPRYIPFSPSATKGALYSPDSGPAPTVGVLVVHRTANFLETLACKELSRRGMLVLCMNPRSDNNEAAVDWNANALDVKSGVEFLRSQPGIKAVLLWGHSGGGPTTTFYQAVAENGVAYCQGANKLMPCGDELAGLPPADGMILVDAHPGNSANALRRLDPAVTNDEEVINEGAQPKIDPALDPFRPENGYRAGASHYSDAFKAKYFRAQAARMNKLIDLASARLMRIKQGQDYYTDDAPFTAVRLRTPRLLQLEPSIRHATRAPRKLLRNDGTIVTEIVESVRPASKEGEEDAHSLDSSAMLTLRSFLGTNAVRATDSMDGVDWCSSNNSVPCAVQQISVPILISAMGGHYFIRDNELHYELAKSADKDFIVIEGATHGQTPCKACEQSPGQYSNTVANFYGYVQKWVEERFGKPTEMTSDDEAITALVASYNNAREERDPAAIEALFTTDADQLVSTGEWRRGSDTLVKGMLGSSQRNPGERTITVETIRKISPDVATADARYEIAGADSVRRMWSTFLVKKEDGKWRIAAIRNMLPAQ